MAKARSKADTRAAGPTVPAENVVAPEDTVSRARARIDALTEKGKVVAAYLRADPKAFQEQAALAAGINPRSYYEWLNGTGEAELAFQAEVAPAILELARMAEEQAERDIGSSENGSGAWANWWKWKLAQRYRKIFGDLAQKHEVELTGKDGGPITLTARPPTRAEAIAELKQMVGSDPEVARLLAANAGGGEDE